jgi:hypothetical protein
MKIIALSNDTINNPIHAKLAARFPIEAHSGSGPLGNCDLLVFDAASCPPEAVDQAIAPLNAGASILLLDATDAHKKVLAARIGFRSHGAGRGYLVVKANDLHGREFFRIIEAKDSDATVLTYCEAEEHDGKGGEKTLLAGSPRTLQQNEPISDTQVDLFMTAMIAAPQEAVASSVGGPPAALVWKTWVYSRNHTYTASGEAKNDLGPPPTNTHISLALTYNFSAALNNAPESGPFQYLGLGMSGIFQNGGMSSSTDTSAGWILTQIGPEFQVPDTQLSWYSSSPANTNSVSTVTTGTDLTVGFDASADSSGVGAGVNGSYSYSNSTTKNITDWYVKQLQTTKWLYAQNTPFDGATSPHWSGGYNSFTGSVQHSYFPAISTSSLQFAVNAVWKTNSVLKSAVTVTCYNPMTVGYLEANQFMGLSTKSSCSTAYSNASDTFSIDLSVVSE